MNEERRDRLAVEHGDRRKRALLESCGVPEESARLQASNAEADFRAGWNACYAELTTKRSEPKEDWFGKEQTRD